MRRPPIDPQLGATLAERRRAARVTQNEIALELAVSEGTISKIETARVPVPPHVRAAYESALNRLARRAVPA